MRKVALMLITILLLSGLAGCKQNVTPPSTSNEETNEKPEKVKTATRISDYYPYRKDTLMSYAGEGNEYAEQKVYFEYIKDGRAQMKITTPGTDVVKVVEYKNGELREIYSEGEFYHFENIIDVQGTPSDIILKEPIKVGMFWTLNDGSKRTITGSDVRIDTPYKEYKALEVTTELGDNKKQMDYYVAEVGHVARIYKDGEIEIKTLLEKVEEDKALVSRIRFYYPSKEDIKTLYTERDIEFRTGDRIEKIFEESFKNPPSDKLASPIPQNTKINSIKLDRANGIVRVDFSKELITEMNSGSAWETEMLKSLVNTFGSYYMVEKVYISTDGEPYSSGHFAIRENEYFTVDDKNVEELK